MPKNNKARPTVVNASQIAAQQNAARATNENRPAGAQGSGAGPQGVRQPKARPAAAAAAAPVAPAPAQAGGTTYGRITYNSNNPDSRVETYSNQPISGNQEVAAPFPQFDWEAWNAEMMARQAAVWESMDAMNSQFLAQMEAYRMQPTSRGGITGVSGSQDQAQVRTKRRPKRAETKTATSQATPQGSGLNIDKTGGQANGLGIGKQ